MLAFERVKLSGARVRDLQVSCTNAAPVNANTFRNCQFETEHTQPAFAGCGGNGLASNAFLGNEFRKGISVSGAASITFEANYFEGGDKQIELVGGVLGASIAGNYFHDWGEAALWMGCNGVRGVTVSGNSFWGPSDGPAIKAVNTGGCSCSDIRVLGNTYQGVASVVDQTGCVGQL